VGVADLMAAAGLTHGGFYNHFASKEALIAEASAKGFLETSERYAGHDVARLINAYVSRQHRDARGKGCPAAGLSGDAARLPEGQRGVFGAGIGGLIDGLEASLAAASFAPEGARTQAISLLAQAVGAVVLSRACPDRSPLADEILDACHAALKAQTAQD
jgi:TetR/AcrR family transcriptional repressor of nem operon